jgi:hypothetical protein
MIKTVEYSREIEEDTSRWKNLPCAQIDRTHTVIWLYYWKWCIASTQSPSKFQWNSSQKLKKQSWNQPLIVKEILSKKRNAGDFTVPDFKLYYRVILRKTAWYWQNPRHLSKWNRTEDTEITHTATVIWFLTKVPITYIGKKD